MGLCLGRSGSSVGGVLFLMSKVPMQVSEWDVPSKEVGGRKGGVTPALSAVFRPPPKR